MNWTDLAGPVLGLAGALTATGFGYGQWRKGQRRKSLSRYNIARSEALDVLLRKLQELEIKSRAKTISQANLEREVRIVNELLIKNRSTLTQDDGAQAHVYLNAVIEIHKIISEAPPHTRESWDWTWWPPDDDGIVSYYFNHLTAASDYLQKELLKSWQNSEN
jgi:hypothetical protein